MCVCWSYVYLCGVCMCARVYVRVLGVCRPYIYCMLCVCVLGYAHMVVSLKKYQSKGEEGEGGEMITLTAAESITAIIRL